MALPTYVASGTANAGTTSPLTPTYPAGLAANDRLILHVFVRAEDATCATPAGWVYELHNAIRTSTQIYGFQWIFSKKATGSESGTVNVTWTGTTEFFCAIAQIYAFRGVTTANRWYEPNEFSYTGGGATAEPMPTIVTTGTDRLALALFVGARNVTVTPSTGETGGNWTEAADVNTTAGAGATLELQTAGMASAGILTGGTSTLSVTPYTSGFQGLALIATGGTLATGILLYRTNGEVVGGSTVSNTDPFVVGADEICFAHVVAKRDAGAVAAFANVPVDNLGGFWTLQAQVIQGTAPSTRVALFKRATGFSAVRITSASFTASGTAPDTMAIDFSTVAGGDTNNLQFKSASAAGGNVTVTLDNAPAADSTVLAFWGSRGGGGAGTPPTGFTQIYTKNIGTEQRSALFYDVVSPVQSAAFNPSSGPNNVIAILVEVPVATTTVTGTGVATRNRLVGTAAGVRGVTGTGAGTRNPLAGVASGNVSPPPAAVIGTGAGTVNPLTGAASGTVIPPAGVVSDPVSLNNQSTTGASHTSLSITPSPNALVLVFAHARRASASSPGVLGLTSTALAFTKVVEAASSGQSPTARSALYWAQAGPSPVAMTVTVTSANADRCATNIVEIAANFSATITNFGTGTNNTGDPSAALPLPPAVTSVVLGCMATTNGPATITHPFGTELVDTSGATTLSRNLCFQNGSGPTSATWSTSGAGSVATLVEIASSLGAVTGTGQATVNRLVGAATGVHATGGIAAATVNRLTGAAAGVHGVTATAAGTRNPLVGAAVGAQAAIGTAAASRNRLSGAAVAVHGVIATAAGIRSPLVGAAIGNHTAFIGIGAGIINSLANSDDEPWSDGTLWSDGTAWAGSRGTIAFGVHGVVGTAIGVINRLAGVAAGVHVVTATAAAGTLNRLTGTAAGTHIPVAGTAAATVNRLTGAATGLHPISGIGAGALNRLSGVAVANHVPYLGTAAGTRNRLVGVATGVQAAIGTAAGTRNRLTGAATGVHVVVGTAPAVLNPLVGDAFGLYNPATPPEVFGNAAGVLNPLAGAAAAVHGTVATAAGASNVLLGNAAGTHVPFIGTAAATCQLLTGTAAGVHGVVGTAAGARNRLTGAAVATHISVAGTAAGVLPPYVGAAAGVHGVVGIAAGTLNPLVGQALGAHAPATVIGTGAGTRAPLTGAAVGIHAVTGVAAATRNSLLGAATGQHTVIIPTGIGAGALHPLVGLAVGVRGVVGTAAALRNQLLGHAVGISGIAVLGTAAGDLRPLVGEAFGRLEQPTFPIVYRDCPVTGFHLGKDNAEFDPERRALVDPIALDEPTPPIRRPRSRSELRRGV